MLHVGRVNEAQYAAPSFAEEETEGRGGALKVTWLVRDRLRPDVRAHGSPSQKMPRLTCTELCMGREYAEFWVFLLREKHRFGISEYLPICVADTAHQERCPPGFLGSALI